MALMPLLAAWMVEMPLPIASSRPERSLARADSDEDWKKLSGLSSAELTFLPVARRFWVVLIRSAVCCKDSRLARIPAERVISDMSVTFLVGRTVLGRPVPLTERSRSGEATEFRVTHGKRTWLKFDKTRYYRAHLQISAAAGRAELFIDAVRA